MAYTLKPLKLTPTASQTPWYENNPTVPVNNPYKVIDRSQQRIEAAGQPLPQKKSVGNLLMSALDVLSRPQYMITNPLQNLTDRNANNDTIGELGKAMWQGLTGERKSSTTDIFNNVGWRKQSGNSAGAKLNNALRWTAGFAGDILLDPTTYISGGTIGLASKGANVTKKAVGEAAEQAVKTLGKNAVDIVAGKLGKTTNEVLQMASKFGDDAQTIINIAATSVDDIKAVNHLFDVGLKGVNKNVLSKNSATFGQRVIDAIDSKSGLRGTTGRVFGKNYNKVTRRLTSEQYASLTQRLSTALQDSSVGTKQYNSNIKDIVDDVFGSMTDSAKQYLTSDLEFAGYKHLLYSKTSAGNKLALAVSRFDDASKKAAGAKLLETTYDSAINRMYFKFAGKPILDITPALNQLKVTGEKTLKGGKEVYKGLANKFVLGDSVFSQAFRKVADTVMPTFTNKHIGYDLMKKNQNVYNIVKQVADNITVFQRAEAGLPHEALQGAAYLFADMDNFMKNKDLRHAAIYFIEKDIGLDLTHTTSAANELWRFITKDLAEDSTDYLKLLKAHNPKKFETIKNLRDTLTAADIAELPQVAAKVHMFNDAIQKMEELHGITWAPKDVELDNAVTALDDYVKHAYKRQKDRPAFKNLPKQEDLAKAIGTYQGSHQHRKFKSVAEQLLRDPTLDPYDDLIASMVVRQYESSRIRQNKAFTESFFEALNPKYKVEGIDEVLSVKPKTGFKEVPNLKNGTDSLYVSPEIYNQLQRIPETLRKARDEHWFLDIYDGFTNILKMTQTSLNPSFIGRNLIGETFTNTLFAGVGGKPHKLAADMMMDLNGRRIALVGDTVFLDGKEFFRRLKGGVVEQFDDKAKAWTTLMSNVNDDAYEELITSALKSKGIKTYVINGKEYTSLGLMREFETLGLGWSGVSKGNLSENTQQMLNKEVLQTHKKGAGKLWSAYTNAGDATETWTRLAHFLDRLEKGDDFAGAASNVRAFHVDYRDLTPTERNVFRRVAPYYTYMRKNTPMQLRILATQPGRMNMIFHLVNSSYDALKDSNGGQDLTVPEYLRDGLALPLGMKENGDVMYLNWQLPLSDLSRIEYGMSELFQENFLDMLSPILKVPLEIETNTNFGLGTPIEKFEGERPPLLPNWQGSPLAPWGKKVDYMTQQFGIANTLRQALGTAISSAAGEQPEALKPRQIPMVQSLLPIKNEYYQRNAEAYEERDQLLDYIKRLEQQGVYVPDYSELKKQTYKFTP